MEWTVKPLHLTSHGMHPQLQLPRQQKLALCEFPLKGLPQLLCLRDFLFQQLNLFRSISMPGVRMVTCVIAKVWFCASRGLYSVLSASNSNLMLIVYLHHVQSSEHRVAFYQLSMSNNGNALQ